MKALEWRDVDLPGKVVRLRPEIIKNKNGRLLPLQGELLKIIERAKQAPPAFVSLCISRQRATYRRLSEVWNRACQQAGLRTIIVHDLRRSAVRNMVRAGIPERVAMSLSGHKTRSVFDRYNIVSDADLARATETLQAHLEEQPRVPVVVPIIIAQTKTDDRTRTIYGWFPLSYPPRC